MATETTEKAEAVVPKKPQAKPTNNPRCGTEGCGAENNLLHMDDRYWCPICLLRLFNDLRNELGNAKTRVEAAVGQLNALFALDPKGMQYLVDHRTIVSKELGLSTDEQLTSLVLLELPESEGAYRTLGPLGLLNMVLRDGDLDDCITARYDEHDKLIGFGIWSLEGFDISD